jgi:hypothetical protein
VLIFLGSHKRAQMFTTFFWLALSPKSLSTLFFSHSPPSLLHTHPPMTTTHELRYIMWNILYRSKQAKQDFAEERIWVHYIIRKLSKWRVEYAQVRYVLRFLWCAPNPDDSLQGHTLAWRIREGVHRQPHNGRLLGPHSPKTRKTHHNASCLQNRHGVQR